MGTDKKRLDIELNQLANMSPILRNQLTGSNEDYEGFQLPASFLNNQAGNLQLSDIEHEAGLQIKGKGFQSNSPGSSFSSQNR